MNVKFVKKQGNSSIVTYRDEDNVIQACIVDSQWVPVARPGADFDIDDRAIETSTPYGVDWTVVFPDGILIPAADVQEVLYINGVISEQDVLANTNGVINAINQLLKLSSAKILRQVRSSMEESQ